MRCTKLFLPMLALAGAVVLPASGYADRVISGPRDATVYATNFSAERVVRWPVVAKVAMTAPAWSCQSIACRNYLVVGVSH